MNNKIKYCAFKAILFLAISFYTIQGYAVQLPFSGLITGAAVAPGATGIPAIDDQHASLPATTGFINYKVTNYVKVAVNHQWATLVPTAYKYNILLKIDYDDNTPTSYSMNKTLYVEYDPTAGVTYKDYATYNFTGAHKINVSILSVTDVTTGLAVTNPEDNLNVMYGIGIERYKNFVSTSTTCPSKVVNDLNGDGEMDELVVSWSPITGAEEYELEWTYVDDYTNGSVTSTIAAGAIAYDFKYNSTRISTTGFNYKINLVYERGYIIYRVRGVGRKLSNIATVIYGTWSITPDIGTGLTSLACGTSSYYYCLGHKTAFNWQYSSTFAEEGKKKEVVGYYDGGLRNRQTVTKINTTDTAIVGESFYDFQGRKAIDALPVPAQSPALTYYPNFNKNLSLTKYSRDDFDKDVTGQPCNVNTGGMSPTTGASRYYSNLNTNSSYQQTFLPDAQNYPFNQVEYTPDNTGRIRKMGGVGPTHQLGNNKETKYYYGRPLQEELDRLFGAEVGYDRHYKKNVVVDPNGQVSISYLDQEGHVIATALSGNAPDNVSGIPGESTALTSFNVDFFNKNPDGSSYLNAKNIDETALIFNTQYLVSTPGQTHSFDYSLTPQVVTDSCLLESICFDCIYDLELVIKDECGNIVYSKFARVGNLTLDNTCGTVSYIPSAPVPFTIPNMAIGNYQISKILTVNRNAYDYYLSQYLDASKNTCFKSYETLLEEEQIALADVECEDNCESCIASLGTSDNYVLTGKGSYEDWLREYNSCLEECKNPSLCEQIYNTMLVDMMPGGQYAQWYDSLELNGFNSDKFPLSILNYNNQLPDGGLVSTVSTAAFWKNPQCLRNNGSTAAGYFEPDGIKRSKIPIIPVAGGYFPAISTSTEDEIINGVKYIYPEHLLYAKDFVTYWQESWAKSLVIYHPEYCYRKWCVINLSDTATSALKSSEDFDNELLTTTSYADAVAKGFISTTVHNAIALADPYFTSVADGISFASQMNTELISNFDGSSMSMKAMAALITKCPAYYGTLSGVTSTCTSFLATGNPIIDDEVWKKYVSFYLSAKQKLIKLAADNYTINTAGSSCGKGYNGCIGADNFNPFASAFNRYLSLGSFASNLYTQPCSWSTYMLYKGKIPRFTIGAEIIKVDEDKAKFNMYYKTGLCPAESDLAMLLHSVTDKGNLLTSFSLQSESAFTKLVYDKIVSSIASPPSGFVEFTWTPVVNTSDPRLLEISFAYSGSPSPTCFINLKLPSTSYSWSMVKDITNIKVGTYNPYTGNSGFVFNAMIDDDANPATPNILVKITGTTCLKLGDCQFYDQCKTSDFGSRLLTLMSALAYNNQLSSISATVINLETSYPNFLNRYLRNALTSSSNNNLRWVQPNSTIANFKLYDISSTGSSQNVEVSFNSFTPSFAISDLYKIKYFTDLTVDDVDVSHGFYVTAWYETSPGVYATVRIQGDISLGSMATCKGPVPVECETKENQAASDLEDLLKNIFSTTPAVSSSLSSNNKYTELLESYIGSGHHTNFENIVANTIEFKADIQMYSSTSTIANTCNFRLFHYNDDWKDDFSTITSVQDLVADDAMKIGDKTYYFKLTVNYANGIQEVVGGYTTCIPIRSCKCESTAEVGGTGSCSDLAKLVMDGITKYNLNIFGNNPSSSFTIPQITESDYNCNCGAGYIDYYLSKVEMTGTSEMPMTYQEYVIFSCEDATASCPEYVNYFNAVTTFNKAHPSAPITIEPISSFTCDCISAYVDYINSFKLTPLPYALPPMSIADFQTGGCLPPSSGGDGCASYGKNYYDMAQNAIDLYNASHTPTIPNLNPYSSYLNPCECFLKYAIYLSGSTPNYPSPPKSFDEFVTQGCVDNDCWIAYYNMIDHLHNAAILAGNVPPYDPPAYDQSMCACYLGYSWYVRSHYGIGMMSLEDYCNSVSSSMRMAQTNSGEFQNEEVETGGENQKKKIIKSDEIKVDKLDTAILVARSSYVSTFVDNTRNLTYRDACPLDTLISPTDTLENPCRIFKANQAIYNAKKRYNDQVLAMTSFFREKYYNKCLSLSETLTGNVPMKDYHYTLYYYDQAGSLVATVPPAGVKLIDLATYGSNIKNDRWNKTQTVYNSHFLKTTYEYNSLNQLRRQSVPDNDKMDVWQVENSGGDITSSITVTDIQFVDGNLGYSIGKDGSGNGYMYKTIDGGLTWKRFDAKSADIKKIKMINTTDGFAVGNDGLFLRTTDGGINWQYIMINASGIGIVSNHLNDLIVEVVSGNTNVLVGGNEGALVKCVLASGAWTFTNVSASPLTSSMNILAMSADVYGSTPTLGKIYLTINIPAASTNINRIFTVTSLWSSVTITDINIATKLKAADLKAVYLYSSTSGYAAGVNGTLLKTTDGGINWIHVATNTIVNFNKLYFKDVTYLGASERVRT